MCFCLQDIELQLGIIDLNYITLGRRGWGPPRNSREYYWFCVQGVANILTQGGHWGIVESKLIKQNTR